MRYLFLVFLLIPLNSYSACTPETIQFYLDKGFTHEQVTKLCAESSTAAPTYQPYQKPVVIYQEGGGSGNSVEERRAVNELRGGLDVRSVDITDDQINYIRNVCVRGGQSPDKEQRVEACIDVAFSISRDGLQVIESGAGLLLFGQQQIEVTSSEIKRKHVVADPWAKYLPDVRFQLKRKYEAKEKGNTTILPVRKSSSPSQIVSALRTIASTTESRKAGTDQSEVAKVLDDSYVPPTEEEYLESTPTYDDIQEEKKKKKKWWNPFD